MRSTRDPLRRAALGRLLCSVAVAVAGGGCAALEPLVEPLAAHLGLDDGPSPSPARSVRPPAPSARPPASEARIHVVRAGDTLSDIARRHGVKPREIAAASGLRDPDRLEVGQRLVIPKGKATPASRPPRKPPGEVAAVTSGRSSTATAASPAIPIATPRGVDPRLHGVDCLIESADQRVRGARFEEALSDTEEARGLLGGLGGGADVARRRARVEVLSATAEVALGRSDAARASFERALGAEPGLTLDRSQASPKVLRVFEEARRRSEPRRTPSAAALTATDSSPRSDR